MRRTPRLAATAPPAEDPFKGEVPILSIVPKQERRFTDKVIRLAEHRPPNGEKGLSPGERVAFREIGDRLKKESGVAADEGLGQAALRGDNDQTPPPSEPSCAASEGAPEQRRNRLPERVESNDRRARRPRMTTMPTSRRDDSRSRSAAAEDQPAATDMPRPNGSRR